MCITHIMNCQHRHGYKGAIYQLSLQNPRKSGWLRFECLIWLIHLHLIVQDTEGKRPDRI
jgi:hypothetical protein